MARDAVGLMLSDAARLLRRRFDARARSFGVTRAQWQVLLSLSRHEGINQSGLADRLEVENITLCRMIDRLSEAGLVERRADPSDRRVWRLYLTSSARPLLEKMYAIGADVATEALAGITPADQERLAELLNIVRANLSGRSPVEVQG